MAFVVSRVWSIIHRHEDFYQWLLTRYDSVNDVDVLELIKLAHAKEDFLLHPASPTTETNGLEITADTREHVEMMLRADWFEYLATR